MVWFDQVIDEYSTDVAQGEGEALNAVAVMMGVDAEDRDHFGSVMHDNFMALLPERQRHARRSARVHDRRHARRPHARRLRRLSESRRVSQRRGTRRTSAAPSDGPRRGGRRPGRPAAGHGRERRRARHPSRARRASGAGRYAGLASVAALLPRHAPRVAIDSATSTTSASSSPPTAGTMPRRSFVQASPPCSAPTHPPRRRAPRGAGSWRASAGCASGSSCPPSPSPRPCHRLPRVARHRAGRLGHPDLPGRVSEQPLVHVRAHAAAPRSSRHRRRLRLVVLVREHSRPTRARTDRAARPTPGRASRVATPAASSCSPTSRSCATTAP